MTGLAAPAAVAARAGRSDLAAGPARVWSRALLALVHVAGFATLLAPLVAGVAPGAGEGAAHASDAPILVALMVPALLAVAVGEVAGRRLDAKGVALLGVLCGLNAMLRIPGGLGGASLVFFLPIVAGATFGASFGFLLGALSLAVSGLATGGVGPWLPFQMLAAGWVGAGAGLLRPACERARGPVAILMLGAYGWLAGFFYGAVTDLWFWPYLAAGDASLSWRPGLGVAGGARAFHRFYLATSLAWDAGRALGNVVLVAALGRPSLRLLRRWRDRMWTRPFAARTAGR